MKTSSKKPVDYDYVFSVIVLVVIFLGIAYLISCFGWSLNFSHAPWLRDDF
jgi:hypothetical protein